MSKRVPCRYFQLGLCNKADKCTFAHVVDPTFKPKPCENFAKGRCKRGTNCTFSHDKTDIANLRSTTSVAANGSGASDNTEAVFKEWRYYIPLDTTTARKLGPAMTGFIQKALTLVEGEAGLMQEVVTLLAGEGGMLRIAELLDQPFEELSDAQLARIFNARLLPFFKILTHKDVESSAVLEGRMMTIYSYVYGHGGQRTTVLFRAITKHLSTLDLASQEEDAGIDEATASAYERSLAVLSRLVEVNTTAQVNEELPPLVEVLSTLLEGAPSGSTGFPMNTARKHLKRLKQRLGLGDALSSPKSKEKNVTRPIFELAREMPGELSEDGPRHDNDHVDIRQISILPTLQEIESSRTEYLPLADPREWHLPGLKGLLDRNFRLLREDTVGQLRDAAKAELERLQNGQPSTNDKKCAGARTYVYDNVAVSEVVFDQFHGLEFALGFDQPKHLVDKTKTARRDWWQGSKRLGFDALICLLSSEGAATFFVVAPELRQQSKDGELERLRTRFPSEFDLWSDANRGHIIARPVDGVDILSVLNQLRNDSTAQFSLAEFPGVLLPAFKPTLEAMQRMSASLDMPFAPVLAPTAVADAEADDEIAVPAYATAPGFQFDLSSITNDLSDIRLTPNERIDEVAQELEQLSTLDPAQAQALVKSLSRSLALIQGPPGTGKSYTGVQLIRALLQNKTKGNLGPILCVTFTNHALDQGLERLIDEGVSQVIRLGSKSKSERLTELNLRAVVQNLELTKTEKQDRWNLSKQLPKEAKEINRILRRLDQLTDRSEIEDHLALRYPEHHNQLFSEVDEYGFTTVNYHKDAIVEHWLRGAPRTSAGTIRPINEIQDLHVNDMNAAERRFLYDSWQTEIRESLQERLNIALASYNNLKAKSDLIRTELDLRALKHANIIGLTTSGLARNIDLLRRVNVKVLLCEEAGEVLEAHLLTALLPSIEHAILIGDHQQLRPHVQNYELSAESRTGAQFALDVSLFERLVQPTNLLRQPLQYSTLEVQRRMHPSISQLVRRTQYSRLQDGPNVSEYPMVSGMRHRMFWMHHEEPEDGDTDSHSTSHTNAHECEMTAALVSHLVKQGIYRSTDIAVITPYLGQLRRIRKKLAGSFEIVLNEGDTEDLAKEGEAESDSEPSLRPLQRNNIARSTLLQALRIATVDNFQGEEAKVIVVSLVRSNKKNSPGFLKTSNRINVLLSRAQHGMYIIGNANTTQHVKMWAEVLDMVKSDNLIGDALDLCCPRHPETPIAVQKPDDFLRLSPEAGCDLPCTKQLDCGHACTAKCHSDMLHQAVYCTKRCTRPKAGCSHNCPLDCGAVCHKECREIVEDIQVELPCQHTKTSLPCYQYQDNFKILCTVDKTVTLSACGHEITVPCFKDVDGADVQCNAVCGSLLRCGHECKQLCHQCNPRDADGEIAATSHGQCMLLCERDYTTCKHRCQAPCHGNDPCPLCQADCDVRCSHSACDKKCNEPCAPCAEERCASHCPHSECTLPCAVPCDWLPCSKRCTKKLACGCQCPSVCGEACPSEKFCQNCATDEIKSFQADLVMFENYGSLDLDEDPCIFTHCGHIFTLSSMDGTMDMDKHYRTDLTGAYTAIKASSEPFSSADMKVCPKCRGSLMNLARYGRIVRRAILDESTKKFTAWSNRAHQALAECLLTEQERLLNSVDTAKKQNQDVILGDDASDQLKVVKVLKTSSRYRSILKVHRDIDVLAKKLRKDEQPYQRVKDLVETMRRDNKAGISAVDLPGTEVQLREHIQAMALLTRCELIILSDVISMHNQTPPSPKKGVLQLRLGRNRQVCKILIDEAKRTSNVRQKIESHIFWARFVALEVGNYDVAMAQLGREETNGVDALKEEAFMHLQRAEDACTGIPVATEDLEAEVSEVKRMLQEGTSASEMRMVVAAMAAEFSGTGHWYRCANDHPFTVGECGMPMQLARCPACGAGIGGELHRPTEGVTAAGDIEERFGAMQIR